MNRKYYGFLSLSILILFFAVFLLFAPSEVHGWCTYDWECNHPAWADGDDIWATERVCGWYTCEDAGDYHIYDCRNYDEIRCSGDDVVEDIYTASGSCCVLDDTDHLEDCTDHEDYTCFGDDRYWEHWTCSGGSCEVDHYEFIEDCTDYEEYLCFGDDRYYEQWTCSGGDCTFDYYQFIEDCTDYEHYFCDGDDRYYEHWECSGGYCSHDYDEFIEDCTDYEHFFCDGDDRYYEHWTCSSGYCVHDYDEFIEDCTDYEHYFCDGTEIWYEHWACSGGYCHHDYDEFIEDCSDYDGLYCGSPSSAYDETGSNFSSTYDLVDRTYSCYDQNNCRMASHDTRSGYDYYDCRQEYNSNRGFCDGTTANKSTSAYAECQSYPEVIDLEWINPYDHDYDDYTDAYGDEYGYHYCGSTVPYDAIFEWDYDSATGDSQTHAEIEIATDSGFSNVVDSQTLTGSPPSNSYTVRGEDLGPDPFNQTFHVRVRVRDENGNWSDEFDGWETTTFDTDYQRANPHFLWSPPQPYEEQIVDFQEDSSMGQVDLAADYWYWHFPDEADIEGTGDTETDQRHPSATFEEAGNLPVTLEVEDVEGVLCESTQEIPVAPRLPHWEEVDPFAP